MGKVGRAVGGDRGRGRRALGLDGRAGGAGDVADDGEPALGVGGGMGLEGQLGAADELAAETAASVTTLDVELIARGRADDGVGQVDTQLGRGVAAKVVRIANSCRKRAGVTT